MAHKCCAIYEEKSDNPAGVILYAENIAYIPFCSYPGRGNPYTPPEHIQFHEIYVQLNKHYKSLEYLFFIFGKFNPPQMLCTTFWLVRRFVSGPNTHSHTDGLMAWWQRNVLHSHDSINGIFIHTWGIGVILMVIVFVCCPFFFYFLLSHRPDGNLFFPPIITPESLDYQHFNYFDCVCVWLMYDEIGMQRRLVDGNVINEKLK